MTIARRARYLLLVARELTKKYTFPLAVGFLLGVVGIVGIKQLLPRMSNRVARDVIRVGLVGEVTPATIPLEIQSLISVGLTTLALDGAPMPALATSWKTTDNDTVYEFTIRNDSRWHSGKPVTSADINYNIRNVSFDVVSAQTLRAKLLEPFSPFLTLVAKPILQTGLKGFGPYRVASIRLKGESVQYLRLEAVDTNDLPAREYRFYHTEVAALNAFALGDIDTIEDLSNEGSLSTWQNVEITPRTRYNRVVAIYFNTKEPILRERGVRQALGYAVPDLPFERAFSPIAKTSWAYSDAVKKYSYDATQAKKLLQLQGVSSTSAGLTITTFAPYVDVAQKIASSWTSLGVPTSVQVVNAISQFQVLLSAQTIPPDPDQYPLWHSTQSSTNLTGYVNVKIDKLLEDGRKELDPATRKNIYVDFAKRLVEDAPAVFLYYPTT
ncbi:ABC transporter substrate-binding protein, partial [Candidatus Gottesmanbacteria bacterium]|nr:ABC transporter substrate-binding protein [Candidatus Gottesmanbacteria bacterium]